MNRTILIAACVFAISSCAPSRYVRPLEEGQKAITGNLGGPLIKFSGMTIPLPLTAISLGYGLKDNLTIYGGVHTTALSFGVIQGDFGVVKEFIKPDTLLKFKPGFSMSYTTNLLVDTWEKNFKFWPQIDANLFWNFNLKRKDYFYLGVSNWFELAARRAHGEPQLNRWLFNPQAGITFDQPNWSYNVEAKYLAPNFSNQNIVVDYAKPWGENGGLGIYFSISKKF